jgi:hypothetical protein
VRSSRLKTKHVAQVSVQQFLWRHPCTYYWTFTVHEVLEDKTEALKRAKPFFDLIGRRQGWWSTPQRGPYKDHGCYLAFWELQKRGSWHLHLLTNVFFDVNWLRPWMVERGWGKQMRVESVQVANSFIEDGAYCGCAGPHTSPGGSRLARYLTKYLTKSLDDCPGKKPFSGSAGAKMGTVGFAWCPEVNPYAYFFYWGRWLFCSLYGRPPKFTEFREVMRLGYEDCDWRNVDPWMDPPG